MTIADKEEMYQNSIYGLAEREFPLISRINKQILKGNKPENEENKRVFFPIIERMTRKFEEIIQKKGVFELVSNEELEFYSNPKHFPYKSNYTKEDDDFITEIRKFGVEKFEENFQDDEDKNLDSYQKTMAFKQMPIDYLIELMNVERTELKTSNMEKMEEIKKAFLNEDAEKLLMEKEPLDQENLLKDLEFFTNTEIEFLNYLEAKQQQNLALMNMDLYDEIKIDNNGNNKTSDKEIVNNVEENEENCDENNNMNNNNCNKSNNKACESKNTTLPSKLHKIIKDDIVCQVCNDGDYSEDNMIVFCSVRKKNYIYLLFLNKIFTYFVNFLFFFLFVAKICIFFHKKFSPK